MYNITDFLALLTSSSEALAGKETCGEALQEVWEEVCNCWPFHISLVDAIFVFILLHTVNSIFFKSDPSTHV